MMERFDDVEEACFLVAYFRFQYNMIARVDDTAKFRSPDLLKPFHQYPEYGVIVKLCWSKTVMKERDAPDQVLIGAMDRRYRVLIGLSMWLEMHYMLNSENNEYIFGIDGRTNPISIKAKASSLLLSIFEDNEFNVVDNGNKGTHGMRKFATNKARGNGCSKDDTDCRARWKRSGLTAQVACDRIYDVYGRNKSVTQILKLLQADTKLVDILIYVYKLNKFIK